MQRAREHAIQCHILAGARALPSRPAHMRGTISARYSMQHGKANRLRQQEVITRVAWHAKELVQST